jgi:putative selenate reductase
MTDRFFPLPLSRLLPFILSQLEQGHYFGIRKELFYVPDDQRLEHERFGQSLQTPVGPAAGPHTQLAQNIVGAWLCGARYIELKTVQTLDELEISKPCIDMQDEGYNCEWSQELKIQQSFEQYLDAWILIHVLSDHLQWNDAAGKTIFNMSVGYNLEGILKPNIQWFLKKMNDCTHELNEKIAELSEIYPRIHTLQIPGKISDNITLSTMHGCPPDEIEKIGMYLINEKGLHTVIKLNPTLLGPEKVRRILNAELGYKTPVPDEAFGHDLKYPDAKVLISNLQKTAAANGVHFGLKLTNTLESNNFRSIFGAEQKQMYMSGKALHPLAVHLAAQIREDFPGIDISFSAGADCFNISELLSCHLYPITVSSDLLKPGGYGRLSQYLEQISETFNSHHITNMGDLLQKSPVEHLKEYSSKVTENMRLKKSLREPDIKTFKPLNYFDCIHAPCMCACPGSQNIPLYMHYVSQKQWQKAFEVIMQTNPLPSVTGAVCDHGCQTKCTRIHYDDALAIREIKHYVAGMEHDEQFISSLPFNGYQAVVIGAGPAGLSCAWFLRLAGFKVTVYEEQPSAGGMVQQVIPAFRITENDLENDIRRIGSIGIDFKFNTCVGRELFEELKSSGVFVFAAIGAARVRKINIPGEDAQGVEHPLKFLSEFKQKKFETTDAGNIIIIGGGNTAMDVALTAKKAAGKGSNVKIVYRRTIQDMPAGQEEILSVLHEGVDIIELAAPVEILTENNIVTGLKCTRTEVTGIDESGRQQVSPVANSMFVIEADMIIPAAGQYTTWPFADNEKMKTDHTGFSTSFENVFVGGDARAGASNIISAIADGRKAAEAILRKAGLKTNTDSKTLRKKSHAQELLIKKAQRVYSLVNPPSIDGRHQTITSHDQATEEADRCLLCDEICNICVSVCPNFANQGFETEHLKLNLQSFSQQKDGNIIAVDQITFEVKQKYQVFNIADFCNECGNCFTFCPTKGAPYKHKPKIHLTRESWDTANEGFRISGNGGIEKIEYKTADNGLFRLSKSPDDDRYLFETPVGTVKLHTETFKADEIYFNKQGEFRMDLENAAVMHVILKYCLAEIPLA